MGDDFILHLSHSIYQFINKKITLIGKLIKNKVHALFTQYTSFWKGLNYMDCNEYLSACEAFENAKAYKHLIIAYDKQGYYEKAIKLADKKKYFKMGAKIAYHNNNLKHAAYFYSYFSPYHAARLYKDLHYYYESGFSFLAADDPLDAIDMFRRCRKKSQKQKGFKQVSEFALVLYLKKNYEAAFKVYMALDDYYSALECAKALKIDSLISSCCLLIGALEAENHHFIFAAKCVELFDPALAGYYYALGGAYKEQVRLLLNEHDYKKAHKVCLLHNNLNKAYEIASTYDPSLLSSL